MNFIMIGLLLREALDRLRVHLNMYLVAVNSLQSTTILSESTAARVAVHLMVLVMCELANLSSSFSQYRSPFKSMAAILTLSSDSHLQPLSLRRYSLF